MYVCYVLIKYIHTYIHKWQLGDIIKYLAQVLTWYLYLILISTKYFVKLVLVLVKYFQFELLVLVLKYFCLVLMASLTIAFVPRICLGYFLRI